MNEEEQTQSGHCRQGGAGMLLGAALVEEEPARGDSFQTVVARGRTENLVVGTNNPENAGSNVQGAASGLLARSGSSQEKAATARSSVASLACLNIRSARHGGLESACRDAADANHDVVFLSETKIANQQYGRLCSGYKVVASEAESTSVGGVAFIFKEASDRWRVEDVKAYGPNVMALTFISGDLKRRLVGGYLPPSETENESLDRLMEAYHDSKLRVILMGDFNVNLRNAASRRLAETMGDNTVDTGRQANTQAALACLGVEDFGRRVRQRKRTGLWTWQAQRNGIRHTSVCDYIMGDRKERILKHRIRSVKFTTTDHRMVSIQIPLGKQATHARELRGRQQFPIRVDRTQITGADLDHQKLETLAKAENRKATINQQFKPSWIAPTTWALIKQKAALYRARGRVTRARRRKYIKVRRAIKKALRLDRLARLDKAATDIERAMKDNLKAGFQAMSKWYKRRDGENLPISQEAMGVLEAEYAVLYAAKESPGEMIPIVVEGQFKVQDSAPKQDEIRAAVRRLPRGKACGPTGIRAENLKTWLGQQLDREAKLDPEPCEEWALVSKLIRDIFTSGVSPQAFSMASLVLIPKEDSSKYRGIALLEVLYKVLATIIATRIHTGVIFHDSVHGFRAERGCSTAIIETKLEMQLARREGVPYHQVFLDLSKAYDTVDQERLMTVLRGYGIGPKVAKVLLVIWEQSRLAPRKANLYGGAIDRQRGVPQGCPLSPTTFNLVIDAIVRATVQKFEDRQDRTALSFYADDGKLGGRVAEGVQLRLDYMTDLFARMGLKMNAVKTVSMSTTTSLRKTRLRHGAIRRRFTDEGARYEVRSRELVLCPHCPVKLQKRSLVRHVRQHHHGVVVPQHPPLYSPSPERPPPHPWRISQTPQVAIKCPYPTCTQVHLPTRSATFRHWAMVHPNLQMILEEKADYQKCPRCSRLLKEITAAHLATQFCRNGNRRRQAVLFAELATVVPPVFTVLGHPLERVSKFKYLGRILADDDSDLAACTRNIERARAKWGQISKVLERDGASVKIYSRFYLVIVSTVLLYGSDTWVITGRMQRLLESFHNRCARHMTRRYIRRIGTTDVWTTPCSEQTLIKARLNPITFYIQNRRHSLMERYTKNRKILEMCKTSNSISHSFPQYWDQQFEELHSDIGGRPDRNTQDD